MWVKEKNGSNGRNPKNEGFYLVYGTTGVGSTNVKKGEKFYSYWNGTRWVESPEEEMPDAVNVPVFWFDNDLVKPPFEIHEGVIVTTSDNVEQEIVAHVESDMEYSARVQAINTIDDTFLPERTVEIIKEMTNRNPTGFDFSFKCDILEVKKIMFEVSAMGFACKEINFGYDTLCLSIAKTEDLLKVREGNR